MVDLTRIYYDNFQAALKKAQKAVRQGDSPAAAAAYQQCSVSLRQYANSFTDTSIRKQWQQKAAEYQKLAEEAAAGKRRAGQSGQKTETPVGEENYEDVIMNLVERPQVRWADVAGLEEVKRTIKTTYGLALARKPEGVEISSSNNILLYGPPGTGKTLLAAATAGSLDATFFNVKSSSMLSKYFGESSKLISALYAVARQHDPAVIFFDEITGLTTQQESSESSADKKIVSTMLTELDGLSTKDDRRFLLTIGATNVPWLLDPAILSRFPRRIYVPLPDEVTRRAILEIHLTRRGHSVKSGLDDLVTRTAGYSGREIEKICQVAIESMTGRANTALLDAVDKGRKAVSEYNLRFEPMTAEDFSGAFEQIRPVATTEMLLRYEDWYKSLDL